MILFAVIGVLVIVGLAVVGLVELIVRIAGLK